MNEKTNYIVSGIERSGTSLMMQILKAGGLPIAYDDSREADKNNPKGYYELEKGKIINKLKNGDFPFDKYKGKFIKITAYGLKYLPKGKYEVIFMDRNIKEIIESTLKMASKEYEADKEDLRLALIKLRNNILDEMRKRDDVKLILISHRGLFNNGNYPSELNELRIYYPDLDIDKAKDVIDPKLYRNKV